MTDNERTGLDNVNYDLEVYHGPKGNEKKIEREPEIDGVNLQCINSSDFVVGKQTTFNGPVTIINYTEGNPEEIDEMYKPSKEEIIIREKVITPATVSEIKAFAAKKTDDSQPEEKIGFIKRIFKAQLFKIPVVLWTLLIIVVITGGLAFFLRNEVEKTPEQNIRRHRAIKYNGKEYTYFTREEWNARSPLAKVELKTPVPYVVISHSATSFCYLTSSCIRLVRDVQGDHMNQSPVPLADIAYSFMVGGDGNIYEGRGWTTRTASTGFVNGKSININFIGSFENFDAPTYPQTEAVKALIEYGVNNSYIDQNYSLVADNSTYQTLSPGVQVYREIKNWPHFDANPKAQLKNLKTEVRSRDN